jgi:hypothetical protein
MNLTRKQLTLAAAIAGGVAALGTLFPWRTFSLASPWREVPGIAAPEPVSGLDIGAVGVLVCLLGIVAALAAMLGYLRSGTRPLWVAACALGLCLLLSSFEFFPGADPQAGWTGFADATTPARGSGLWLSLLGSAAGGIAAVIAARAPGPQVAAF